MKTVVIGANGQLGSEVVVELQRQGCEVVPLVVEQMDISDSAAVRSTLTAAAPDVVINTAAFHNVEECEMRPEMAFLVNGIGSRNVALVCKELEALLIGVSTDYVFDGRKGSPYLESDCPFPLNVYANTKLAGEWFIRSIATRHHIVRVCGLFGKNPCLAKAGGLNFVELMLKLAKERDALKVVDNEVLTPTSALEAARQIALLAVRQPENGIYHATAEGQCSWYEFADEIFKFTSTAINLKRAQPGDFPVKVMRPAYSVLENAHLKRVGLNVVKTWQEGLHEYLGSRPKP